MKISPIAYGLLGENLIFSGVDNLTKLPIGTLLLFRKDKDFIRTASLMVCGENQPCEIPAKNIRDICGPSETSFQKAAMNIRGVTGIIYSSGFICEGDKVEVKLP